MPWPPPHRWLGFPELLQKKDGFPLMLLGAQVLVQILANGSAALQQLFPLNCINSSALGLNNQPPKHDFMPQLLTADLTVHVSYLQKQFSHEEIGPRAYMAM